MPYPQPQYQPPVQQPNQAPPISMPQVNHLQGGYPPPPQPFIQGQASQQAAFNQQHSQMVQNHQNQSQAHLGPLPPRPVPPQIQALAGIQQQRDPASPLPQQVVPMQDPAYPQQPPLVQQPPQMQPPQVQPPQAQLQQEILTGFTPPIDPAETLGGYGVEGPAPPAQAELPPPGVMKQFAEIKGLSKSDASNWSKYSADASLDDEQNAALTSHIRSSIERGDRARQDLQAQTQAETARERAAWNKELMSDKDYANNNADQFVASTKNVAKLVKNYCPELFEELASSNHMLRPSLIKGLNRMAQALNGSNQALVQGNPFQQPQQQNFYEYSAAQRAAGR